MELPQVIDGNAHARFLANGIRHIPDRARSVGGQLVQVSVVELERALSALAVGTEVEILAEQGNDVDENATLVTRSGMPLGWVPRFLAPSVRQLLAHGN